jgi:hypothetical protein
MWRKMKHGPQCMVYGFELHVGHRNGSVCFASKHTLKYYAGLKLRERYILHETSHTMVSICRRSTRRTQSFHLDRSRSFFQKAHSACASINSVPFPLSKPFKRVNMVRALKSNINEVLFEVTATSFSTAFSKLHTRTCRGTHSSQPKKVHSGLCPLPSTLWIWTLPCVGVNICSHLLETTSICERVSEGTQYKCTSLQNCKNYPFNRITSNCI